MEENKRLSNKKFILIILALLLLALGFRFGIKLFDYLKGYKDSGISVTKAGYLVEKASHIVGTKSFSESRNVTIQAYGDASIKAGEKTADLWLVNPKENTDLYYLQFQIMLDETKEVLYKSNLLEPGKEITEIELNKSFEEGEYKLFVLVTPVKIENPEVSCNQASYNMTLKVGS